MAIPTNWSYWTDTRSANPAPVCRKGGCGTPAVEGSEWCDVHDVAVKVNQAWADEERGKLRSARMSHSHSKFGHADMPLAGS